jgi:hypothetical protein
MMKGIPWEEVDPDDLRKQFWGDADNADTTTAKPNGSGSADWRDPDMSVLRLRRRPSPALPLQVFGDKWGQWIADAAAAASCPPDYVALPLLAIVSVLVGNARWAQATRIWKEPPHLWMAPVGDSGDGKSPGAGCLLRDILPELEDRMLGDFPERHQEWRAAVAFDKAAIKRWEDEQRAAMKEGKTFDKPMPRPTVSDVEPQRPCLRHNDITVEEVAAVLATGAPKGVVVVRDELAGWLDSMTAYNPAGRAFWLESYGGGPYRVGRRKHSGQPIDIRHLVVAVYGGSQPERLTRLIADADDGLLSRIQWGWPDPLPFELGEATPNISWAIEALDRLRELDLAPGDPPTPIMVPLTPDGRQLLRKFARDMDARKATAGGLLRSAFGKARGTALRLSLLEELWWCAQDGLALPPSDISERAFKAAAALVSSYFMPMAERVFGDAAATDTERMAATLARWIIKQRPDEVHVRHLQREVRLPGLRTAEQIKRAADALVEADWLRAPMPVTGLGKGRAPIVYLVNPLLKSAEA